MSYITFFYGIIAGFVQVFLLQGYLIYFIILVLDGLMALSSILMLIPVFDYFANPNFSSLWQSTEITKNQLLLIKGLRFFRNCLSATSLFGFETTGSKSFSWNI